MEAAAEPWTILARIPNAVKDEEAKRIFPPGTDISVACNGLPSASVLTVPLSISSPPYPYCNDPYIAAADRSGLLLLKAKNPLAKFSAMVTYHLCDARTGEVISLCKHMCPMDLHAENLGRRCWFGEGVISHGGMLWWVDLSYGLLACDPFAEEPELLHVPLPRVLDELPVEPINHSAYCCAKVSGGRLRYVQIHGSCDAPVVTTWALADPASAGEWKWNTERSVCLADIWADESYLETMLPRSMPALALLHPMDPDRLYFFLDSCIFAIDLSRRIVVEFSGFRMPDLPKHPRDLMISSHFVHAWEYDSSRSAAKMDGSQNFVIRRHQQALRQRVPTHVFKRKQEISEVDLKKLVAFTLR
ncbi:hypothetical protein U9M48_010439 [Paspalum notatum var. saurae]|uniref:DUF1618 domain-containing protein n=1 Tax=Paspalum notatum var. saurae TaxID=547442 RepID=A0AAQ3WG58_PASNO